MSGSGFAAILTFMSGSEKEYRSEECSQSQSQQDHPGKGKLQPPLEKIHTHAEGEKQKHPEREKHPHAEGEKHP